MKYKMISICDISYQRNNKLLFKDLGLTIFPGTVLALYGENGSGKTSLLKIIAGFINPDKGKILYNDVNILEEFQTYCSLICYIGHKLALKSELTVLENIALWADIRGHNELIDTAIHYFELGEYQDVKLRKLSAGWQKRVALARIIISNAKLWILDEPYSNLDEKGKEKLDSLIETRIKEKGIAIISSHQKLEFENIIELNLDYMHKQCSKTSHNK